jgi:hypothetical protein
MNSKNVKLKIDQNSIGWNLLKLRLAQANQNLLLSDPNYFDEF